MEGDAGGEVVAEIEQQLVVALELLRDILALVEDRGWTATVTSTDFTTGTGTGNQDIPAANVSYSPGLATATSGTGTFLAGLGGALGSARTAFTASLESGTTSVSWNPTVTVTLPSSIAAGTYTGTVTHSVA